MDDRTKSVFTDPELVEQFADDPEALALLDAVAATQTPTVIKPRRHVQGVVRRLLPRGAAGRRHRPVALAACLFAVLVAAAVASAFGLFPHHVDFGHSPHANGRVVREFSELPRVTALHGPGPLTGPAREVYTIPSDRQIRLYAAPAARGFCWGVTTLGGTCVASHSPVIEPFYSGRPVKGQREPGLIAGAVRGQPERISLTFEDGSQTDLQLIYVSRPIAASFFVYEVPADRWRPGFLPTVITVYGSGGDVAGRGRLMYERAG
jgi:hypothetical protein